MSAPVGIIIAVSEQPFRRWQAVQQGGCGRVVADLACGHEAANRACIGLRDGVQFGGYAALGPAERPTPLIACPPF